MTKTNDLIICGICGSTGGQCLKLTENGECPVDINLWNMCEEMDRQDNEILLDYLTKTS